MRTTEAYLRYSDKHQDDGFSIEYQIAEINEFAARNGLEVYKLHIDQAQTATKVVGREAFFAMIERVKDGTIGTVIVYKLNRMFRNAYESQKYRKLFRKHNVRLLSATQVIDEESSAGRLMTNVLSDIDQYQSETTSDHVKSSMREMARQGYFTGGAVTFGFTLEAFDNGTKVRKKLKPLESEAAIVREIYEKYSKGTSLTQILRSFQARNITKRNGREFMLPDIARILRDEKYIGVNRYKTKGYDDVVVPNCFEAIISPVLWDAVQARHTEKKPLKPRFRKGKKRNVHCLTGFVVCAECGEYFTGYQKTPSRTRPNEVTFAYYGCRKKQRQLKCGAKAIRKDFLEAAVMNAIREYVLNPSAIKNLSAEVSALCENRPTDIESKISELTSKARKLEKNLDTLVEMRLNGEVSASVLTAKSAEIEAELKNAKNKIYGLTEQKRTAVSAETIEEYLTEFLKDAHSSDGEIMRRIVEAFVDRVVVSRHGVDITLKVYSAPVPADKVSDGNPHVTLFADFER